MGRDMSLDMRPDDMRGVDMRGDMRGATCAALDMRGASTAPAADTAPAPTCTATRRARRSATTASTTTTTASSTAPIPTASHPICVLHVDGHRRQDMRRRPRRHRLQQARLQHAAAVPAPDLRARDRVRHASRRTTTIRRAPSTRAASTASYNTCAFPGGTGARRRVHARRRHRRAARLHAADRLGARHLARPRRLRPGVRRQPGLLPQRGPGGRRSRTRFARRCRPAPTTSSCSRSPARRARRRCGCRRAARRPRSATTASTTTATASSTAPTAPASTRPTASTIECKPEHQPRRARRRRAAEDRRLRHAHDVEPLPPDLRRHLDGQRRTSSASRCTRPPAFLCNWTQSNGADHVITIFHTPPPGVACDAIADELLLPGRRLGRHAWPSRRGRPATTSSSSRRSAPGAEGPMHISVSRLQEPAAGDLQQRHRRRRQRADRLRRPACFGVGGCKPPICIARRRPRRLQLGHAEDRCRSTSPPAATSTPPVRQGRRQEPRSFASI